MKNLTLVLITFLCTLFSVQAQSPVDGMKYQAVARDLDGNVLAFEEITLEVALHTSFDAQKDHYREIHNVETNQFGLFSVTIGQGNSVDGDFSTVPWESMDIYMAISLRDKTSGKFNTISDSKLLAVPYAFHALSATRLSEEVEQRGADFPGAKGNIPWFTNGNKGINDLIDKLGPLNAADLVIISNNEERLRILADGDIITAKSSDLYAQGDFFASRDVQLNTREGNTHVHGALTVDKSTTLNDALSVENGAPTSLTGTLEVDKNAKLNSDLEVDGMTTLNGQFLVDGASTSHMTGDLRVDGITNIESTLNVNNGAPTFLSGDLTVLGLADISSLKIEDSLNAQGGIIIGGETVMQDAMSLTHNTEDYVASFTNTNSGAGDGIKISLGRTHPRWNGSEVSIPTPGISFLEDVGSLTRQQIKNLLMNPSSFSADNFTPIGERIVQELNDAGQNVDQFAAASCILTNDIINEINSTFGQVVPEIDLAYEVLDGINSSGAVGDALIPDGLLDDVEGEVTVGPYSIPDIPSLQCPDLDPSLVFTLPNISLIPVNNSLTKENQFIQFTDQYDNQLGAVRAESIQDWCDRYLDFAYFMTVMNSFAGVTEISVDPVALGSTVVKYAINGATVMYNLVASYNSIGVEYSSGFGDYAEWLERLDYNEQIHTGDIVGVIGGKITKDLTNAEQVMAVSFRPIVLGNSPEKNREHLGNKVAFMGQIPVKVMGPVKTGDYIIGDAEIAGYGKAVDPADMTANEFRLAVGRSWAANPTPGPKMVNTVVGVHNGDYMHILNGYQEKLDETEKRLSSVEEKIEILFPELSNEK